MSTIKELARRLNSMCDQAGQPDWTLGEFLDGVRNVSEDLERVSVPPEPRAAEAKGRDELQALCDLALSAREMEERAKKAEYQVLGYKGDYDELCKRYTTCERELGSVMKERDAMREAIKRAVERITPHCEPGGGVTLDINWARRICSDLEQALKGGK